MRALFMTENRKFRRSPPGRWTLLAAAGLLMPGAAALAFGFPPPAATTERVSVVTGRAQANDSSGGPSVSADGRFVAFGSYASNLVPGDTNGAADVFVRDRVAGTTGRVSVATGGAQGND